jgi:hypothetical protein
MRRDGAGLALEQVRADDDRRVVPVGRIDRVVRERQQIDGRRLEAPVDVLLPVAGLHERPFDRRAGLVLDVEDAREPMRALERPVEPGALPVEGHLELLHEELLDEVRALSRDQRDGLGRADAVAGALDVGGELLGRVARGARDDAALGVEGVRLAGFGRPRDEGDAGAVARRGQRGGAPRDTRAENQDVGRLDAHARSSSSETSAAATEWVSAPTDTASTPARA